jgi:hypothetical protein
LGLLDYICYPSFNYWCLENIEAIVYPVAF